MQKNMNRCILLLCVCFFCICLTAVTAYAAGGLTDGAASDEFDGSDEAETPQEEKDGAEEDGAEEGSGTFCPVLTLPASGDVNGDSETNVDDVSTLLYHVFWQENEEYAPAEACDYNGDGAQNSDDAAYLLYHIFWGEEAYPLYYSLIPHRAVTDAAKAPTCTEKGLTEGSHCEACDAVFVEQTEIPPLEHKYGAPAFSWDGYSAASAVFTCENDETHSVMLEADITSAPTGRICGELCYTATVILEENEYTETKTEELSEPRHTVVTDAAKAPTCTETGFTEGSHCGACGLVLVPQKVRPPLGHDYVVEEESRPLGEGEWYCTMLCPRCEHRYTEAGSVWIGVYLMAGGIDDVGASVDTADARRTVFLSGENVRVFVPETVYATVYFYGKNGFIGKTSAANGSFYISSLAPEGTVCFRVAVCAAEGDDLISGAAAVRFEYFGEVKGSVSDVAESAGALHAIWRFAQMEKLTYYPLNDIPQKSYDFTANEKWMGLPYSSTRPEALFVPNNVSLYTFMTSLYNPNSYLYSVDISEAPYYNENGATYYGAVCSTAAAYALNIIPNYSTHQWAEIPGMQTIDASDLRNLVLCDTAVGEGHVVMITGIDRAPNGEVLRLYVSEASGDRVKCTLYTPEAFKARFSLDKYTYCRYEYLADVPYTPSEFVAVGDEEAVDYVFDLPLVPRKGDRANWLYGMAIEIDVLADVSLYAAVRVYREGVLVEELPVTALIVLEGLATGYYTACLWDGEEESKSCSFLVTDVRSEAVALGADGAVHVTFTSTAEAKPLWVQWTGLTNGTRHITVLTDEEAAAGEAVCRYQTGSYKVRVAFETAYGIIHSELPDVIYVP